MFKIISSEEHAKLTKDVDYWKALALKEDIEKGINNEHQCNQYCFKEHVLPAIQRDYDYRSIKFKNDWQKRHCFIQHWKQKLKNEYDFLESLYMIVDTIMVSFKA